MAPEDSAWQTMSHFCEIGRTFDAKFSMQRFGGPLQVILAGTLTTVQGDIRRKVLAALSTVK